MRRKAEKKNLPENQVRNKDHLRLELVNLVALLRSSMIGREEFEQKIRDMGVDIAPDILIDQFPAVEI